MKDYDLIVIGAGPGGYNAALRASSLGVKTAVIEQDRAGGTCLNRGCIPTKTLLNASAIYKKAKEGAKTGVEVTGLSVNLPVLFAKKDEITSTLSTGIEGMLKKAKVDLIKGRGRIVSKSEVEITDNDGNTVVKTCDKILIATGSIPAMPPIPGLDLPGVMTSDEILNGSDKLYESVVIIGGGVIGAEFAGFYSDLGVKVTVIEGLGRLLPGLDKEIGQNLSLMFKKHGVDVYTDSLVSSVTRDADGLSVNFKHKDEEKTARGEVVLCAIGRKPYTGNLFGEGVELENERGRIIVDDSYETSVSGIYAIGDVSSKVQLAHVAEAQARDFVNRVYKNDEEFNPSIIPGCVYSHPEIATVGITEAQAKEEGIPVKCGKCVMGGNARTMIADSGRSFMKIVAHKETGAILGAAFMCENATDMISQISQAIAGGLTAKDLLKAMRPHPTFEEAMGEALEALI